MFASARSRLLRLTSSLFAIAALTISACARDSSHGASAVASVASVAREPELRDVRYLALGDSFTAGTGSASEQSFPSRLADRLRDMHCKVTLSNLGVNGYTTDDLIEQELPRLPEVHATFVTLAIGANDIVHGSSADRYRSQVHKILAAIIASGVDARHIVALPQPDWSKSPVAASFGDPAALLAQIEQFNLLLKEETESVHGEYIDLFPLMEKEAEKKMIANDGLHPSSRAYDEWSGELSLRITL